MPFRMIHAGITTTVACATLLGGEGGFESCDEVSFRECSCESRQACSGLSAGLAADKFTVSIASRFDLGLERRVVGMIMTMRF